MTTGNDVVQHAPVARLRLTPQKREFFDLFTQASANAREIARLLVELLARGPTSRERLADIREAEHEGDRLTHEVINLLNRTFVTPLDRDDMYRLASAIDDVCDHVDEAADNIDLYEVRDVPARAQEQADVVYRAASRLHEAVELLEGQATRRSSSTPCASSRTRATGSPARRSPTSSAARRTRSRSSAGRTSTSRSRKRSTRARTPPTCSRRSSSRTAELIL